eukprot:362287-Alexandrium_andersonii.AAC.1
MGDMLMLYSDREHPGCLGNSCSRECMYSDEYEDATADEYQHKGPFALMLGSMALHGMQLDAQWNIWCRGQIIASVAEGP